MNVRSKLAVEPVDSSQQSLQREASHSLAFNLCHDKGTRESIDGMLIVVWVHVISI